MSVSTDGILFWGIAYGDQLNADAIAEECGIDKQDFTFEDLYAARMGFPRPNVEYTTESKPLFNEYWDQRRELVKACTCEVEMYCSLEYTMWFACIKTSKYHVYRGYETEIPNGLASQPEWMQELKDFCELMGLEYRDPKWLLVSYWG